MSTVSVCDCILKKTYSTSTYTEGHVKMVRHYISKGTRTVYPQTLLDRAKKMIDEGQSLRKVAKDLKIEKMFLCRYMKKTENHTGINTTNRVGHKKALPEETEASLAENLKTMAKNGFALSKEEVLEVVKEYVEQNALTVPFKNNRPGHDWYKGFCQRQKLSLKKMEPLEKSRRLNTSDPFIIYHFYDLLEEQINELKLDDKPSHIYNLDETSFCADPSRVKLLSGVGQKAHRTQEGSGRENTTVLACCNAAGKVMPPLIIFQGANLWSSWKGDKDVPGTFYACSDKGWMTSVIFHAYFEKFCQEVKERPLLLIFDGHLTHLDIETAIYAKNQQVIIVKLPAHTTDVLQPLDKTCFKTLKYTWDLNIIQWYRSNQRKMTKSEFVNILCSIWYDGLPSDNVKAGFTSAGIYPVDRKKYPVSRLDPEKLARYNAELKKKIEAADKSENAIPSVEVSNPSDVYQPSSSNWSQPPPSNDSESAVPSTSAECSVALSQSVTASPSTDRNSGSSTPMIRTSPSTPRSFEMLLLQRLNKTVAPQKTRKKLASTAAIVTSEEWIAAEQKKKQEMEEKESRKKRKKLGGGVKKKNKKTTTSGTSETQPTENANKEVNLCSDEITRKDENQIIQEKQKKQKKRKKITVSSDSDSDIPSEIDFADNDSSDYDKEDFIQMTQREEESDLEFEKTLENCNDSDMHYQHTIPTINDWVVVKFATKKKVLHYVGQVIDIEAGEPKVKFARIKEIHEDTSVFCWKEPEDVSFIENEDVEETLVEPALGRRGELIFNSTFQYYNIQ